MSDRIAHDFQPLLDLTVSSILNAPQLNYDYSDFLGLASPLSAPPWSSGRTFEDISFNSRRRLSSLSSTTTTLVSTPDTLCRKALSPSSKSPGTFALSTPDFAPSPPSMLIDDMDQAPSLASFFATMEAPPLHIDSFQDVSPVVRAGSQTDDFANAAASVKSKKKLKRTGKQRAFVDKLRAAPPGPSFFDSTGAHLTMLRSPCKLVPTPAAPPPSPLDVSGPSAPNYLEPESFQVPSLDLEASPLTPLTPLTPIPSTPDRRLKIVIPPRTKRLAAEPLTPMRRSKRARNVSENDAHRQAVPSSEICTAKEASSDDEAEGGAQPAFTKRTLPPSIEISSKYQLFYRRFPASSYYQPLGTVSPFGLFGARNPGGTYNAPRSPLDLYTPRFVKGRGPGKVGLCPICIEPAHRGGERKKVWLAMKFSAFKCYHMQYAHGISASTGLPFSPPTSFRIVPRANPGKKEKHMIEQGKCHKCRQWVIIEGVKDMESKVKELHWWKHAASCHQATSLPGETDYYEEDDVLAHMLTL